MLLCNLVIWEITNDYQVSGGKLWLGDTIDERTLWILGTKNTELHVQLLNICIQYSPYKKLSPTLWTVEGMLCISSFLRRIEKKQWQREFRPHFRYIFSYRNTLRCWGMFSLTDTLNITQVILFYLQVKIWEMQKSMTKVKCIHNLIPRHKFSWGKLYHIQAEASPHPKTIHLKQQEHHIFPPSIFPSVSIPSCSRMNYRWLHDND